MALAPARGLAHSGGGLMAVLAIAGAGALGSTALGIGWQAGLML